MEHRPLGRTGVSVSKMCLGTTPSPGSLRLITTPARAPARPRPAVTLQTTGRLHADATASTRRPDVNLQTTPSPCRPTLYADWRYVLVAAGSHEAAAWRDDPLSWRGAMPDLIFPADRSWLLSRLGDDDWRCLGGPSDLAGGLLHEPLLDVRRVELEQYATPPGHTRPMTHPDVDVRQLAL